MKAPINGVQEERRDGLSVQSATRDMAKLTEEYRYLQSDDSQAAKSRRIEIKRALLRLSSWLQEQEEDVIVTVPFSQTVGSTGKNFEINGTVYAGVCRVKASVAAQLLHMIDQDRRAATRLFQSNQREFVLPEIGRAARMAEISAD